MKRRAPTLTIGCAIGLFASAMTTTPAAAAAIEPSPARPRLEAAHQFTRGKALSEASAFEEAEQAYLAAIALDDDPYIRLEIAQLLVDQANSASSRALRFTLLGKAATHAGAARDEAPNNPDILRLYGQINLGLAEVNNAAVDQAQDAYESLRQLVEGDVQGLVSLAQIYLWKRQFSQAADVLREATSYRADHPVLRRMLLDALLGANALDEAEPLLVEVLEADPRALDQRMTLAEIYSRRGDSIRALAVLEAAPADMRREPRVLDALAAALHRAGENERALATLGPLISEHGVSEDRLRLRVSIFNALARYDEAISALDAWQPDAGEDAVEKLLLRGRLLERIGREDEAIEALRVELAKKTPGGRTRLELELAGILERSGRGDDAVARLRRLTNETQGGAKVLATGALADLLHRAGETREAVALLDETATTMDNPVATQRLALRKLALLTAAGDWPGLIEVGPQLVAAEAPETRFAARIAYSEALAREGRLADALDVLASANDDPDATEETRRQVLGRGIVLRLREGDETKARQQIDEVVAGGEAEDLFFAAQLWQQADRYDEMVPLLEALLEKTPESTQAQFALATALERTGAIERATATFRQLLDVVPDHAPSLNYLGYMMADRGDNLREALTLIRRAVAIDPDNGAYVDSLGWVFYRLGRYEQAQRYLEWAARLIADDPAIHDHLGDLYAALERPEQARASYVRALALDVDNPDQVQRKLEALDG